MLKTEVTLGLLLVLVGVSFALAPQACRFDTKFLSQPPFALPTTEAKLTNLLRDDQCAGFTYEFAVDAACKEDETRQSQVRIHFWCALDEQDAEPKLMEQTDPCVREYEVQTHLACEKQVENVDEFVTYSVTPSAGPWSSFSTSTSSYPNFSVTRSMSPSQRPSSSRSSYYYNSVTPSMMPSPSRSLMPSPSSSSQPAIPPCQAFPIQGLRRGYNLTLFGSTTNAPSYYGSCQHQPYASPTVWYSLVPGPYANITVTTCNSYTNFDTVLSLLGGPCTNLQCIMSNDDSCGTGSTLSWTSAPDLTYYISVSGANAAYGNYELILSSTGSADPTCTQAVYLPGPYFSPLIIAGSNQGSVPSSLSTCGLATSDYAVWYHISPLVGSPMAVSTCSSVTNFDTSIAIFDGGCASTRCVAYNDNNCTTPNGNNRASTVYFTPTSNSYYVVVSGTHGSTGYYQMILRQEKVLGYSCQSPFQVVLNSNNAYYTASNAGSANLTRSICASETGQAYWFQVQVTRTAEITIDTCSSVTNFDTFLSVYSGDCNSLSCVAYNDDSCDGNKSQLTINRSAGQNFFVVVSGYRGTTGSFGITFTVTAN